MTQQPIAQSGSNRRYIREATPQGTTQIRVIGTSLAENRAFCYLSDHFRARGINVPQVTWISPDGMSYLQEDLGDSLLFDRIRNGRETGVFSPEEQQLLTRTLSDLAQLQVLGAQDLDWSRCYPVPAMDRRSILWDLNYWKYCFLKYTHIDFDECALEDDFDRLADYILSLPAETFLYRDFQSRNVMVRDTPDGPQPWFIDFQGGRRGPFYYDLASFLWQATAHYPDDLRERLLDAYYERMRLLRPDLLPARPDFRRCLQHVVLFRTLQVLGAYGFRGWGERKQHFLRSIPPALANLRNLFGGPLSLAADYPALADLSAVLSTIPAAQTDASDAAPEASAAAPATPAVASDIPDDALTVTIYSFSFKRGIPEDPSGNGGGYVFDCRSTHNPGKYDRYKSLTGLDQPVIDFLLEDGEITAFLDSVWRLTDHHVGRFLERRFTHLRIAFGCTGGQHRSVYCAEATARHLHEQFGVRIRLIHREQHIERTIE